MSAEPRKSPPPAADTTELRHPTTGARDLRDYARLARSSLPPAVRTYVCAGAGNGSTMRHNRSALRALLIQPRIPTDTRDVDTSITLFGTRVRAPLLVAPMGLQCLVHPDGERAMVRGAGLAGTVAVVSTVSSVAIEAVAEAARGPLWFQLYLQRDWRLTLELIHRAEAAGCEALMLTVDTPTLACRDRHGRATLDLSAATYPNLGPVGLQLKAPAWSDIERVRASTRLPLLLKGIMNPQDADQAADMGVDGIVVSNHGGRNLDSLAATAEVLPTIADRLAHRILLLADSGVRCGTDVFKMLALGAAAVLAGRPCLYGLHVAGAAGVRDVLEIICREVETTMALAGRRTIDAIDRSAVWRA